MSKQFQFEIIRVDGTMSKVEEIIEFFKRLKRNEFENALDYARAITFD